VTARITLERISAREVRVTVTADIRITGDLGSLLCPHDAPAEGEQQSDAALQEFLTVEQAAEVLNIGRDKVYGLIRTGPLRSIKIGRLRRISRQWIAELARRQEPGNRSSQ
jgi:excisionase family DNA binding protein